MKFKIAKEKKVLVTGGTGFIAGWLIKQLVEAGVSVHATVRDPNDNDKVGHLLELSKKGPGKVILFKANLLETGSFDAAIKDCSIVFHTASPFVFKFNDPVKDFIDPALKGTQNVLAAVNSTTSVERVVLTSSCTAIYGDANECELAPNKTLNEEIWNTLNLNSFSQCMFLSKSYSRNQKDFINFRTILCSIGTCKHIQKIIYVLVTISTTSQWL